MQAQNFMRVEEVAQELGISKSHAYKVIHILVAFSEFPVPMPVYVCISFVTYEHPLYRFIVLLFTGSVHFAGGYLFGLKNEEKGRMYSIRQDKGLRLCFFIPLDPSQASLCLYS